MNKKILLFSVNEEQQENLQSATSDNMVLSENKEE